MSVSSMMLTVEPEPEPMLSSPEPEPVELTGRRRRAKTTTTLLLLLGMVVDSFGGVVWRREGQDWQSDWNCTAGVARLSRDPLSRATNTLASVGQIPSDVRLPVLCRPRA